MVVVEKKKLLLVIILMFSFLILVASSSAKVKEDHVLQSACLSESQSNGGLAGSDHVLCLSPTDQSGVEVGETCCYRPDGSKCTPSDIELFKDITAGYWDVNIFDVSGGSKEEDETREAVSEWFDSLVDSDGCFSTYKFDIQVDDGHFVEDYFMPFCTSSDELSQGAAIFVQELGDETNPDNVFVCYQNQWYNADKIKDFDEEYEDGDGVGLFFDCDVEDPFVYSDMSMYAGFEENLPANICGDGKNNACQATYTYEAPTAAQHEGDHIIEVVYDGEEWTLEGDSCHVDAVACESNCLAKNEKCDYLSWDGFESGDYEWIDYNENDIEDPGEQVYSSEAEYEEGEGFCCGAGLVDLDSEGGYLGDIKDWSGGSFACLNEELIPQTLGEVQDEDCPGDWCWIRNDELSNIFQIFTINLLGETGYDIVSDGDEWLACKDDASLGPRYYTTAENLNSMGGNRLYCTKEGDHYSWTECVYDSENGVGDSAIAYNPSSIKLRGVGDGGFSFPVNKITSNTWSVDLVSSGSIQNYKEIYSIDGDNTLEQTIDFTDYGFIEFFVTYVNEDEVVDLPANIRMIVNGLPLDESTEDEIVYFDDFVLGYSVNAPSLEVGNAIHVRVPVGNWQDISTIVFETYQAGNDIEVNNVFLSENDDETTEFDESQSYICSGVDNIKTSSWISDLDVSDSQTNANGESICTSRYGPNAWLGTSEGYETNEVESGVGASCCGNTDNEYYSGLSKKENNAACFNSEPLVPGQTVMTIEYLVDYYTNSVEVVDEALTLTLDDVGSVKNLEGFYWVCPSEEEIDDFIDVLAGDGVAAWIETDDYCETSNNADRTCEQPYTTQYDGDFTAIITCDIPSDSKYEGVQYGGQVSGLTNLPYNSIVYYESTTTSKYYYSNFLTEGKTESFTYGDSPVLFKEIEINLPTFLGTFDEVELEIEYCGEDVSTYDEESGAIGVTRDCNEDLEYAEMYFFTPFDQSWHGEKIEIDWDYPSTFTLQIVAQSETLGQTSSEVQITDDPFSYPCLSEECRFALPGQPPYHIENSYPELYDMYYVGEIDGYIQEVLITNDEAQIFEEVGSLVVRDISQQVLYIYDDEDETGRFYGCNAVYYIDQLVFEDGTPVLDDNYGYCSVEGEFYCAFSEDSLITTWSDEGIYQVGYAEVEEYTEDTVLELYDAEYLASELNHSTSAVPGRNVISNADFEAKSGSDLDFWQVIDSSGSTVDDENGFVEDDSGENVVEVSAGYTLRSGKIQVIEGEYYSYTEANSCGTTTITRVDKDGDEDVVSSAEYAYFPSNEAVYFRIEVTGECDYSQPYLQIIDDLGAAEEFEYNGDYSERAAAACCPDGMCWNGYVCVGDMAVNTYMVEDTGKESMYRCIDGDWTHLEPQYDWNDEYYGFCETDTQCFVTSSLSEGASSEAELADFYTGAYPTCINDGEYLLDHYCDAGEWSSRTKFIASQLKDFADTDDYVLFCSDYDDVFVDYNTADYNYMNYVAGEVSATVDSTEDLGDSLTSDSSVTEITTVCFDALENSETGRRLVDQEDNTCINSVCILKYKQSGELTAAFGASMNINSTEDQSFLIPLGISQSDLDEFCVSDEEGTFVECSEQLWYASDINSLIYARDGISISGGIVDTIVDWIVGLFSSSEEDTASFIEDNPRLENIYLASGNGIDIRVAKEKRGGNETIVAEFDMNEDIAICDFINNAPYEYVFQDQWPAEPEELVDCELTEEGVYKIMATQNSEYWWPSLTSQLDPNVFGQRE